VISQDVAVALDAQFDWALLPSSAVSPAVGNLFIQDLPDDPDGAIAVFQYGGSAPEETLGNPVLIEKPRTQIIVRDVDITVAFSRSYEIFFWLTALKQVSLNGVSYMRIRPIASPAELGPDSANRQRVVVNYEVWRG